MLVTNKAQKMLCVICPPVSRTHLKSHGGLANKVSLELTKTLQTPDSTDFFFPVASPCSVFSSNLLLQFAVKEISLHEDLTLRQSCACFTIVDQYFVSLQ